MTLDTSVCLRVGSSTERDPTRAAVEAARQALEGAEHPCVALVFATPRYDNDALAEAWSQAFGDVPWAGCSAVGVFAGVELLSEGVAVAVVDASDARARVGVAFGVAEDAQAAGQLAVGRALEGMPVTPAERRRLLVVLPDSSSGSAVDVLRGALREGGNGVVWAGGGAGDMTGETTLVQFAEGSAHTDSAVVVAIDLPRAAGTGVAHGWRPFGSPAMVTRAERDLVAELEYRAAFDIYREAAAMNGNDLSVDGFGEYAMLHPLGIPQVNERYLVRDPVAVVDGSLRCVAEIPEGALVRTMRAGRDDIVEAAGQAASAAAQALGSPLAGALIFDCMSRHLILGGAFGDELVAYRDALGADVPMVGCLSFGEIASFGREVPQFHNKTAVVVALPR
jgi:hypothetical protein